MQVDIDVLRRLISYIYQGKCKNSTGDVVAEMKVCAKALGFNVDIEQEALNTPPKSKTKQAKKTPMTIVHEEALQSVGRSQRSVSKKSEDVEEIQVETPSRGKSTKNNRKGQTRNGKASKKEDGNNDKEEEEDDEEEEYEVETIIDKRKLLGEVQYLVKWKGWEKEEDRTWEPLANLSGSGNLVDDYERNEAEKKKSKTPKRKSDVKFVHGNGDSMSEAEESPKKESPRSSRKENKKTSKKDAVESPASEREKDSKRGRKAKEPEPIISSEEEEDEEESYEVEKILKMRKVGKRTEFLIKWKGWEEEKDLTWETENNLSGAKDLLEGFLSEAKKKEEPVSTPGSRKGRKSSTASKKPAEDIEPEVVNLTDDSGEESSNKTKTKSKQKGRGKKEKPKQSRQTKRRPKAEREEEEDEDDEYEVEKILKKRKVGGEVEYQVKWKGWDREEDLTWEPVENLSSSSRLISEFESKEEDELSLCEEDECQRIFTSKTAASKHKTEVHQEGEKTKAARKSYEDEAAGSGRKKTKKRGRSSPVEDEDEPEAKKKPEVSPKPKYKPGPKSRQKALNPWMDQKSPDSDSSDSEEEDVVSSPRQQATFDDLFGGASNDDKTGGKVVFNKDSDDESGNGDNAVNIEDLMGGSENEEEVLGLKWT